MTKQATLKLVDAEAPAWHRRFKVKPGPKTLRTECANGHGPSFYRRRPNGIPVCDACVSARNKRNGEKARGGAPANMEGRDTMSGRFLSGARSSLAARLWNRVSIPYPWPPTDGCWEWTGATTAFGYGVLGRGERSAGLVQTHRLSWELHNGPIPEGMCVLHKCDNPPCVNPSHLWLGTRLDNNRDMLAKGRYRGWNARNAA